MQALAKTKKLEFWNTLIWQNKKSFSPSPTPCCKYNNARTTINYTTFATTLHVVSCEL